MEGKKEKEGRKGEKGKFHYRIFGFVWSFSLR
jgi:hypothetical protein